jgi:hypothetical protein
MNSDIDGGGVNNICQKEQNYYTIQVCIKNSCGRKIFLFMEL